MRHLLHHTGVVLALLILALGSAQDGRQIYREGWRPQFHFTPPMNWMNDPNGLVYFGGEYHLFYQHNPFGDAWGHMSWGHAVSRDFVHWQHLPVALPEEDGLMMYSDSVVVDKGNTSGFSKAGEPPMVAAYTAYNSATGDQTQNLAYSTDRGRFWAKYAGNPVLDIAENDFRDPKVFWHPPSRRWVIVVALPLLRQVRLYGSPDLKAWTHLSDFGPAGAVEGAWEVPDLFELPDERSGAKRWVLTVSVSDGAPAGGSGVQYFVGTFDGSRFRAAERVPVAAPVGDLIADFEGGYGGWTETGDAFGARPATGAWTGQQPVDNFLGSGFVNTFRDGDALQGTLTSPPFRITHPHISFLLGGGRHPRETGVNLLVGGEVVKSATGADDERLEWRSWNVSKFKGQSARFQIVDLQSGSWGHVNVDHIVQTDSPLQKGHNVNWVDYGKDFYAPITWDNLPGGPKRRIWLGWMSNWRYADVTPTAPWRGAQSVPRDLALHTFGDEVRLVKTPVRELRRLRGRHEQFGVQPIRGSVPLGVSARTAEIIAVLEPGTATAFGLSVRGNDEEETLIGYDVVAEEMSVDRRYSGEVGFSSDFPGVHTGPLPLEGGRVRFHILFDASSIEVFGNAGHTVVTDQIFPTTLGKELTLYAAGGDAKLISLDVWELKSVWDNRTQLSCEPNNYETRCVGCRPVTQQDAR